MEDIKFPLKKRKGKDFSPSSRDHRMSGGKKIIYKAQKYLFCDQLSKMAGSAIRRHFEEKLTEPGMCISDKWVLGIAGARQLDLFGVWG